MKLSESQRARTRTSLPKTGTLSIFLFFQFSVHFSFHRNPRARLAGIEGGMRAHRLYVNDRIMERLWNSGNPPEVWKSSRSMSLFAESLDDYIYERLVKVEEIKI
jgi:hypothetical protein